MPSKNKGALCPFPWRIGRPGYRYRWGLSRGHQLVLLGSCFLLLRSQPIAYARPDSPFQPCSWLTWGLSLTMPFFRPDVYDSLLKWRYKQYIRLNFAQFQQKFCRQPSEKAHVIEYTFVDSVLRVRRGAFFQPSYHPLNKILVLSLIIRMRKESQGAFKKWAPRPSA